MTASNAPVPTLDDATRALLRRLLDACYNDGARLEWWLLRRGLAQDVMSARELVREVVL